MVGMEHYYYLGVLVFSITGLLYADRKYGLVLFRDSKYFGGLLMLSIGFFLIWDLTGIILNVFSTNSGWVSGLYTFTPNLPLEEFLFLFLFGYTTLLTWRLVCLRTS
jgi:lycopene cyclase domain-containing protein